MRSLTSCQCAVCHPCFKQHFTVAIRDKHIRDMVCPICQKPDINKPQHLDSYFSTLDIQVGRPAHGAWGGGEAGSEQETVKGKKQQRNGGGREREGWMDGGAIKKVWETWS